MTGQRSGTASLNDMFIEIRNEALRNGALGGNDKLANEQYMVQHHLANIATVTGDTVNFDARPHGDLPVVRDIPDGMVKVFTRRGGAYGGGGDHPDEGQLGWLVSKERYAARGQFGFVVDPTVDTQTGGGIGTNQYKVQGRSNSSEQAHQRRVAAIADPSPGITVTAGGLTLHDCTPITDLFSRSPDAEFMFDSDELDEWDWYITPDAPISSTGYSWADVAFGDTIDQAAANFAARFPTRADCTVATELERMRDIESWMRTHPSPADALNAAPPIITEDPDGLILGDGWHRQAVARHVFGMGSCPMIVGVRNNRATDPDS